MMHLRRNSKNRNARQEQDQEHQLQTDTDQTDTDQTDTDEARQLAMDCSTHTVTTQTRRPQDHDEEGDEERRRT